MKNLFHLLVLFILLCMTLSDLSANPPPAYEGSRLYVSYCQLCHGTKGKGDGTLAKAMQIRPADLTTTVRSRSDTILKKIITGQGRQTITGRDRHNLLSDAMPEWRDVFSESEIEALIAYLRFLSKEDGAGYEFKSPVVDEVQYFGIGVGIGLRQGQEELKSRLNDALKELINSGELEAYARKIFPFKLHKDEWGQ